VEQRRALDTGSAATSLVRILPIVALIVQRGCKAAGTLLASEILSQARYQSAARLTTSRRAGRLFVLICGRYLTVEGCKIPMCTPRCFGGNRAGLRLQTDGRERLNQEMPFADVCSSGSLQTAKHPLSFLKT
jgi:hypothetical protein